MKTSFLQNSNFHFLSIKEAVSLWSWFVPVVRVLDHVELGYLGLFIIEILLLLAGHTLPPRAQDLRDVGVVQLRAGVQDLPSLVLRPDHERIHRSLDVILFVKLFCWLCCFFFS